jgi:hypothetical protein
MEDSNSQSGVIFVPIEHWAMSRKVSGCSTLGVLLMPSGQRPGVLFNMLNAQGTSTATTTQRTTQAQMSIHQSENPHPREGKKLTNNYNTDEFINGRVLGIVTHSLNLHRTRSPS